MEGRDDWPYPLLNKQIDDRHRASRRSSMPPTDLTVLQTRTSSWWTIDERWVPRLSAAGLLPFVRICLARRHHDRREAQLTNGKDRNTRRQHVDRSLLTALVDRWRPETHTFHLPCGEMAITLQDVAMLTGLPIAGRAVALPEATMDWRQDIIARFACILPTQADAVVPDFNEKEAHGPTLRWLSQFTVERMPLGINDIQVSCYLEAFLLWLFGWVMFTCSHGNTVDARLVRCAREIAEGELSTMTQWSWGSAVLAATYRGLCEGCMKTAKEAVFTGCPLLVMLWSYERFPFGRPCMDHTLSTDGLFGNDPLDGPTFGILWCYGPPRWSHVQVHNVYDYFTEAFDQLVDVEVRWWPYTLEEINARAPGGLSAICFRDQSYWMTRKMLVYGIFVEAYNVHRVMRQFKLHQQVPVPPSEIVPPSVHMQNRKGAPNRRHDLVSKMTPWVEQWSQAQADVVRENRPYDAHTYPQYVQWFTAQTRIRLVPAVNLLVRGPADLTQLYPMQSAPTLHLTSDIAEHIVREAQILWDRLHEGVTAVTQDEVLLAVARIRDKAKQIVRLAPCRQPTNVYHPSERSSASTWPSTYQLPSTSQRASMPQLDPASERANTPHDPPTSDQAGSSHWQAGFTRYIGGDGDKPVRRRPPAATARPRRLPAHPVDAALPARPRRRRRPPPATVRPCCRPRMPRQRCRPPRTCC